MAETGAHMPQDTPDLHFCGFHRLMPYRVESVLLVSSLYESFILEEEGLLSELITGEYLDPEPCPPRHEGLHAPRGD